jgi:hypothetical protein
VAAEGGQSLTPVSLPPTAPLTRANSATSDNYSSFAITPSLISSLEGSQATSSVSVTPSSSSGIASVDGYLHRVHIERAFVGMRPSVAESSLEQYKRFQANGTANEVKQAGNMTVEDKQRAAVSQLFDQLRTAQSQQQATNETNSSSSSTPATTTSGSFRDRFRAEVATATAEVEGRS